VWPALTPPPVLLVGVGVTVSCTPGGVVGGTVSTLPDGVVALGLGVTVWLGVVVP
jgi:hypothetical protein